MSKVMTKANTIESVSHRQNGLDQRQIDPNWLDRVDIIIKTFLRPAALLRLLESINRFYPHAHMTIVDDGEMRSCKNSSSVRCSRVIEQNPNIKLIELPFASGVVVGRNALIDRTEREFVLLLDDDFCFTPATRIERMFQRLHEDVSIGLVAGVCIDLIHGKRARRRSGGTLEIQGETLVHCTQQWRNRATGECNYVPHFFMARRELFHDIRWDIGFGGEHYDFLLQLLRSDWKVVQDEAVQVDHYPLTETLPNYIAFKQQETAAAQQRFLQKWNLRTMLQDGIEILKLDSESAEKCVAVDSDKVPTVVAAADQAQLLAEFWKSHPWPTERPNLSVPEDHLGWFLDGPQELLSESITPNMHLIVELGAWLGLSTRFIADRLPNGRVITVDHWQGSPEHRKRDEWSAMLPTLFESFLMLNWDYREQILPLRMSTIDGLRQIHAAGLQPNLIFIDADHSYESVGNDLATAYSLFPKAHLVGDDYESDEVRLAVTQFAQQNGFDVELSSGEWRAWRLVSR